MEAKVRVAVREFKRVSSVGEVVDAFGEFSGDPLAHALFVELLNGDAALARWPPRGQYAASVYKALLTRTNSEEVSDGLAEKLALAMTAPEEDQSHLTLELSPQSPLTLRVFEKDNVLGLRLWPAAEIFAAYVAAEPGRFNGATIVELGAGIGLAGLAVAKVATPKSVWLTDGDPTVLQNLHYNVEISDSNLCFVMAIDWTDFKIDDLRQDTRWQDPDRLVILAADALYDPHVATSFAEVLRDIATLSGKKRPAEIWLINEIRDERTWKTSLDALHSSLTLVADETDHAIRAIDHAGVPLLSKRRWHQRHKPRAQNGALRLLRFSPSCN